MQLTGNVNDRRSKRSGSRAGARRTQNKMEQQKTASARNEREHDRETEDGVSVPIAAPRTADWYCMRNKIAQFLVHGDLRCAGSDRLVVIVHVRACSAHVQREHKQTMRRELCAFAMHSPRLRVRRSESQVINIGLNSNSLTLALGVRRTTSTATNKCGVRVHEYRPSLLSPGVSCARARYSNRAERPSMGEER